MAPLAPESRSRLKLVPSDPAREAAHRDEEIIAAVRAGEGWGAAALHDRVRPVVERTLRRLVGSRDADFPDFAQNALIEIASTMHRYRGDCSLDSWVSTITSRIVYKQFRRRTLERRLFGVLDDDQLDIAGVSAARAATAKNMLKRVVDHLKSMDEGRSWAYWLHDVCGHDLKEIAAIMNVSVAAAQSRLVRGRKELHERIKSDPELAHGLEEVES